MLKAIANTKLIKPILRIVTGWNCSSDGKKNQTSGKVTIFAKNIMSKCCAILLLCNQNFSNIAAIIVEMDATVT